MPGGSAGERELLLTPTHYTEQYARDSDRLQTTEA